MPESISSFGESIDDLAVMITIITGFALVIVEAVLIYSVLRFRRRSETDRASYLTGNSWRQARWVLIPVLAVVILDIFIDLRTSGVWEKIKGAIPEADLRVGITGQQYAWIFTYPGPDGRLGTGDDFQKINEFHVPIGKNIVFDLKARDVLHSFWVPALRLKQDALPGRTIQGWFKAIQEGQYDIMCAEICGTGHGAMKATLHVHPVDGYEKWLTHAGADGEQVPASSEASALTSVDRGRGLVQSKGCLACHSTDGARLVGPTYKGIAGRKQTVLQGEKETEIIANRDYLVKSILDPSADIVKGYAPSMPFQRSNLTDQDVQDIVDFLLTFEVSDEKEGTVP